MTRPVIFSKYSAHDIAQTVGLGVGATLGGAAGLGIVKVISKIFGLKNTSAAGAFMALLGAAVGCKMGIKESNDIYEEFVTKRRAARPGN